MSGVNNNSNNVSQLQMQYTNSIASPLQQLQEQYTSKLTPLQGIANQLQVLGGYDGSDLYMAVLVLEIKKKQNNVQKMIKKIEFTSKMKEAIGTKIQKLRDLKTLVHSKDTDNNSSNDAVTMADVVKAALGEGADVNNKDNIRKACEQFGLMETQFIQDPKTGNVTESAGQGLAKGQSLDNVNANTKVNATLIDEKIQALTDKQQQYGNELEIDMIKLNDMLAKLAQDVQMLANINKSVNERRMGVVQKMS